MSFPVIKDPDNFPPIRYLKFIILNIFRMMLAKVQREMELAIPLKNVRTEVRLFDNSRAAQ